MSIKAIETIYNGYRFRSRLEARWAVFFDALGVKYEYEKEGYFLPKNLGMYTNPDWNSFQNECSCELSYEDDGLGDLHYLPDFWLPDVQEGLFVEIKGKEPSKEEHAKAHRLEKLTGYRVAILGSVPYPQSIDEWKVLEDYRTYFSDFMYEYPSYIGECGGDHPYTFCECPFCGKVGFTFDGRSARVGCNCKQHSLVSNGDKTYNNATPRLIRAYTKARQARFEHGECG